MILPLTQWTLHGDQLPQRLLDDEDKKAFSLPGADALDAFADLIGADEQEQAQSPQAGAPYCTGALFEEDICGAVSLVRDMDFSAMEGDYALLAFEHIVGSGEVRLGDRVIARFGDRAQDALRHAYA